MKKKKLKDYWRIWKVETQLERLTSPTLLLMTHIRFKTRDEAKGYLKESIECGDFPEEGEYQLIPTLKWE